MAAAVDSPPVASSAATRAILTGPSPTVVIATREWSDDARIDANDSDGWVQLQDSIEVGRKVTGSPSIWAITPR